MSAPESGVADDIDLCHWWDQRASTSSLSRAKVIDTALAERHRLPSLVFAFCADARAPPPHGCECACVAAYVIAACRHGMRDHQARQAVRVMVDCDCASFVAKLYSLCALPLASSPRYAERCAQWAASQRARRRRRPIADGESVNAALFWRCFRPAAIAAYPPAPPSADDESDDDESDDASSRRATQAMRELPRDADVVAVDRVDAPSPWFFFSAQTRRTVVATALAALADTVARECVVNVVERLDTLCADDRACVAAMALEDLAYVARLDALVRRGHGCTTADGDDDRYAKMRRRLHAECVAKLPLSTTEVRDAVASAAVDALLPPE
jgi:hypothetical protein